MTAEEFSARSFDYIVIGGGTAGLVVAARLSEDPNVTVGVLEAGKNHLGDPLVETPGAHLQLLSNPTYDYTFKTEPQEGLNGRRSLWPRGKGLGGSSAINFMMFSQASKGDLDNWVKLGNDGWGWEDLLPYYRKFEKYVPTDSVTGEKFGDKYIDPLLRGTDGPISTTFSKADFNWLNQTWLSTCANIGYPAATDPRAGTAISGFHQLTTIDPTNTTRSYAAKSYYKPNADRTNLVVLTEAAVSKIVFNSADGSSDATATGVEYIVDGKTYTASVTKEIIVSAGAINSPQVLELSGIGSKEILEKHGIKSIIENPAVGENLQDHAATGLCLQAKDEFATAEVLHRNPELVQQALEAYAQYQMGPMGQALTAVAFVNSKTLFSELPKDKLKEHLESLSGPNQTIYDQVLTESALSEHEALIQFVPLPTGIDISLSFEPTGMFVHDYPGNYITLAPCSTRPFSRGSVHINSTSPTDAPLIDAAYLKHPIDLEIQARSVLEARKIATTKPLVDHLKIGEDGLPFPIPTQKIPNNLEEAKEFVKDNTTTEYHPIGTCSMMPKEQGGVVDTKLKVYGTSNVRVVDASVFPLHVQGNIVSIVYAVAEKAADLIKNGQ